MSVVKVCVLFFTLFVLTNSNPVPDVFFETKHGEQDGLISTELPILEKDIYPAVPEVSGIVFSNPPSLCAEAVENVDQNCVKHCKVKGYNVGLCFETKCTCV